MTTYLEDALRRAVRLVEAGAYPPNDPYLSPDAVHRLSPRGKAWGIVRLADSLLKSSGDYNRRMAQMPDKKSLKDRKRWETAPESVGDEVQTRYAVIERVGDLATDMKSLIDTSVTTTDSSMIILLYALSEEIKAALEQGLDTLPDRV